MSGLSSGARNRAASCRISFARSRRHGIAIASVLSLALLAGCRGTAVPKEESAPKNEILVSAAISLKEAFAEIAIRFQAATRVRVIFNFAGSGELAKQVEFGAPADVFASAGDREMDELSTKGLINASSRADFAGNTLVVIVPSSPGTAPISFSDLSRPRFKRIAIGNPQTVPAGHYAQQALESGGLWERVKSRLILAENVRQVLEYVARGEVDSGLVYATDLKVAGGRVQIVAGAPRGSYGPIRYPIATIAGSKNVNAAQQFVAFVLSAEGQEILAKHGFNRVR
jgi:molybdate transport system substrate-binding protein